MSRVVFWAMMCFPDQRHSKMCLLFRPEWLVGNTISGWLCSMLQIKGISSFRGQNSLKDYDSEASRCWGRIVDFPSRYTCDILIKLITYQIIIRD